ncbi:hypothetical protein PIB30_046580 [Stylosanthes scabra]|uniref:Uncharacterized protein n=1 Tax=Stylosanthes scabra TaxID=79078 RepID=A0ABU6YF96_9FABA|nr:hypothetical protein [Stylosanthes scabra]
MDRLFESTPRRKTGLKPLSPSQHLSGVELISKEDHRAKGHHTPPPISQGLRGNITRSTRRKTGLRGLMPPSQLSLGFAGDVELPHYLGRKFLHRPERVFWFIDNAENAFRIQFKKRDSRIWLDHYDISVVMRCCKP